MREAGPGQPFLRLPPFPRHRAQAITVPSHRAAGVGADPQAVITALRECRVGSDFWAGAVEFPPGRDVILCPSSPEALQDLVEAARGEGVLHRAVVRGGSVDPALPGLGKATDPWQACEAAAMIIADADDEWALVAALSRCPLVVVGDGRFAELSPASVGAQRLEDGLERVVRAEVIGRWLYVNPFANAPAAVTTLIEMMGEWRRIITANRGVSAIFGVAPWKRVATDALLWDGARPVRYARPSRDIGAGLKPGALALAWMARTDAKVMDTLAHTGVRVGEIEDGMIRSNGLGANCVPPLSIVVDAQGPHFDPAQPSELEDILQTAEIGADVCARAASLRETIVTRGIGKYGQWQVEEGDTGPKPARRVVLVTGQVEDDRSILCGGAGLDNLELLRRTRALEPDAWIVFKPHPDVEAGHRKGHVPDPSALRHADEIDRTSPISALLAKADAVHVITSLAGFEALLRGCEVTTHGVPFYAGWGLTRDVGPVPERRSRRRTLDELVAATLILYPRYLDPVTRLPCQPEVLVERIATGQATVRTPRILFREILGRARLILRRP